MKMQWNVLALALLLGSLGSALAAGTESGGGGDPDAVDFLWHTKTIGEWALRNPPEISDTDAQSINAVAKRLAQGMDNETLTPISMVENDLFDESGASKVALYDLGSFKIQVTRSKWKALTEEEKFVVAALELFGLSQVRNRYEVAGLVKQEIQRITHVSKIVEQNWSYESATKVGPVVTYHLPGIYTKDGERYWMAARSRDLDIDFQNRIVGFKMAGSMCKALGHEAAVSVAFRFFDGDGRDVVGAFFEIERGYVGLRRMLMKGGEPDHSVEYLSCK